MNLEKFNKLMNNLLVISSLVIVAGALMKLQRLFLGDLIFWFGIWFNFVISSYEIYRLKKILNKLFDTSTSHENAR
jgi:hypothetical protein